MDKQDLRQKNLELVRETLKDLKEASKPELAEASGLSVVTVNAIMEKLLEKGDAKAIEETISRGGRRAKRFRFAGERHLALSFFLHETQGRSLLTIFLENLMGEILAQQQFFPEEVTKDYFLRLLSPYIERYPQIAMVVAGLPGESLPGGMENTPYKDLEGVAFDKWLEKELNRPVHLFSETQAALIGYTLTEGSAEGDIAIGLYFPEGRHYSAAILVDDTFFTGKDGAAGIIDHHFGSGETHSLDHLRETARVAGMLIKSWNPHRLAIYNEKLSAEIVSKIKPYFTFKDEIPVTYKKYKYRDRKSVV